MNRPTSLLLNFAHALDHLILLVFASAVTTIALEFGLTRWEDLMPYAAGAFIMFGFGSVPSGRLGDLWGRRKMMLIFFYGTAITCFLVAMTQSPIQIAIALTLLGCISSIYHPVGIPMLLKNSTTPGATIGWNNLWGNMGVAVAALLTGFMVKYFGWRAAFVLPGLIAIVMGILFSRYAPEEAEAPSKKKAQKHPIPRHIAIRAMLVMTAAGTSGALLFNFTTNSNNELLRERFTGIISDPATLGILLAMIYTAGAITQVVVGRLIDRVAIKPLYLGIVLTQIVFLAFAVHSTGWLLFALTVGYMAAIFGAIPFIDTMVARYIDDRMRSRVTGIRIAIAFGVSGLAVYLLGPIVKAAGFETLLTSMAIIACCTAMIVVWLPSEKKIRAAMEQEQQSNA